MTINRRRAPSSKISKEKKIAGHKREDEYALLISGKTIPGTGKSDIKDPNGLFHSVKSGKKWQVFLYGHQRIRTCSHLFILSSCLDSFTTDAQKYFSDREKCIEFKESYIRQHGKDKAKVLSNDVVKNNLGDNVYMQSKEKLALETAKVCEKLHNKTELRLFLREALFNNGEVSFLAIKDTTYKNDQLFKVFEQSDVLDLLADKLFPCVSDAGHVPEDYNVKGQKVLLCYYKDSKKKNIVEIEVRNDSDIHYRQIRFNMYSKDVLYLLLEKNVKFQVKKLCDGVILYGNAIGALNPK